jgi:GT2 family glycosyltransferase/tetratricopeptide (TPR) repeat protein
MVCAILSVHDDSTFLAAALRSVAPVPRLVLVSKVDWTGNEGDWESSVQIAYSQGAEVVLGEWPNESAHREAALKHAEERGFEFAITMDSDEILEPVLLENLLQVARSNLADRVYIEWNTYWKDAEHVVRPREPFTPCIMVKLGAVSHIKVREYSGGRPLFLNESYGVIHHLSYAGSDERIWKKVTTWGHKDEIIPGWWEKTWRGWDSNRLMRNLHPTHPESYQFVERITLPECLAAVGLRPTNSSAASFSVDPCDIVIPAYGQQELLNECLKSLEACSSLFREIIVVDDASEQPLTVPDGVRLIRNQQNLGFAGACNVGMDVTKSETIVFLNSDTRVPYVGLGRLLESLSKSGSIAATGPLSNNVGHFQRIESTYTSPDNLELFADEFSRNDGEDRDVDMLVGFCMAVKRAVLEEVGGFDTRFGRGLFEDNDLCYRMRRAGYRLVISARAFVHHEGSKSIQSLGSEVNHLLSQNQRLFVEKWKDDLESGFASNLSGLSAAPIQFSPSLKPEIRREKARKLAERADISLCMIVKNEERTIRACLESVQPFVREICLLDTGSSDRTVELALECGAKVREIAWPNSFAAARTESMRTAVGKWIMWVDADDTVPLATGERILQAVLSAPADVIGFVVPVRFLEEHGQGTEVDHVKVFRNYPGLEWEGRIHEQILPSLRRAAPDGRLGRLDAYVLHSGYDISEAGQARKRERDEYLLQLDLQDRPDHPFVLFNLGMTAHYTSRHDEAVRWLKQSIENSAPEESHVRKAYALLVGSLKELFRATEAEAECQRGLTQIPGDPELLFLMAGFAAKRGDHLAAIDLYRRSMGADISGAFSSIDPGIRGWKARHNMALSLVAIGDWDAARETWKQSMIQDGRAEAAGALFTLAVERGDMLAAKDTLDWVRNSQGETGLWPGMLEALCNRLGIDPSAHWIEAVRRNPANDEARRLLAQNLLNSGRAEEAIPHLDLLQRRGHFIGAVWMAQLAASQGDSRRSEAWFARARELGWAG